MYDFGIIIAIRSRFCFNNFNEMLVKRLSMKGKVTSVIRRKVQMKSYCYFQIELKFGN